MRGLLKARLEKPAAEGAGKGKAGTAPGALPLDPGAYDPGQDDALATLMQVGFGLGA